ncbi:hypothetical protein KCV01_g2387, partial [Aureobasidium melanogenum]
MDRREVPDPYILFVGRLVPRKGASWFVRDVLPRLPRTIRFIAVGKAWDSDEEAALRGSDRVDYRDFVSAEHLRELRQGALAVVMPNLPTGGTDVEGFGLAALEAVADGGVLLASGIEGLVDAVVDGETGFLLPAGDVEAWASRIEAIRDWAPTDRSAFIAHAREIVAARFSARIKRVLGWAITIAAMGFFLQRVMANASRMPEVHWSADAMWVMAGTVALALIAILLSAAIWQVLLVDQGVRRPWRRTGALYLFAQFGKYLPGNVGQFVGRTVLAGRLGIPVAITLTTMLIEVLWGVGTALGLSALALLLYLGHGVHGLPEGVNAGVLLAAFACLFMTPWMGARLLDKGFPRLVARFFGDRGVVVPRIGSALRVSVLYIGCFFAMGAILHIQAHYLFHAAALPWLQCVGFFALAWLAGYVLPGAPAGLGVRESMMVVLFSPLVGETIADARSGPGGGSDRFLRRRGVDVPDPWGAPDFSHMHWYTLHGYSFGYPAPVPLATGLPLAVVTGWFLRLGMSAADGYTAAVACGLLLGFVGAFRLAARLGASFYLSVLAAVAWITMPMTWAHEAYSSLALGMAMLPLYVSSAQACLERAPGMFRAVYGATEFVVLCTVALFMDGYTFMMFATVAWLSLGVTAIGLADGRWRLLARVVPLYALGFLCAWLLYTGYMGRSAFDVAPMGFFRGWAVDLSFIVWPSHGQLWAWDMLGLGQVRTEKNFFGDPSVWCTTFALPLILAGMLALWSLGRPTVRSGLWMAVAVLGLYLALGPTLKVDATKATVTTDQLMPASAGVISTGTEWLYLHVPGFRSMRAVYRWEAVFLLGLWGLVALAASRAKGRSVWAWAVVYSGIIFFCMPHLGASWLDGRAYRRGFASIDRELAAPLSSALRPGERVFFLPLNNDVIATYLSPRLGIRSYSVAGDKQLEIVQPTWSSRLRRFEMYHFDQSDLAVMRRALVEGDVDAMVVTYYNSLWSAHLWPCAGEAKGYSQETLSLYGSRPGFACPASTKRDDAPLIEAMRHDPLLAVHDDVLFAVVRLKPEYAGDEGRRMAKARLFDGLAFPADVAKDEKVDLALDEGCGGGDDAAFACVLPQRRLPYRA